MTRRREGWAAPDPWQGLRRIQRAQKRLADGSLAGATNLASPVAPVPAGAPLAAVRAAEGGAGGSPSIAWLNNSEGAIGGLGGDYQEWDQLATQGDTSWFEFPTDYWGPSDRAAFRFVQPGIFTVIARVTGTGITSVEVTAGGSGTLAVRGVGDVADSLCGSGMFIAEQVEPADYEVLLIQTTGGDPVFSSVAIEYWPGEPAFTQF